MLINATKETSFQQYFAIKCRIHHTPFISLLMMKIINYIDISQIVLSNILYKYRSLVLFQYVGALCRATSANVSVPLRKNHMKKPTCESCVKLEQHFTCDPHVVKTHVIHMWNTCDFTMGDF